MTGKNGRSQTRTLNKAVSHTLPGRTDQIALCLRNFTKMILNMQPSKDKLPSPPDSQEVQNLKRIDLEELGTHVDFFNAPCDDTNLYFGRKSIPGKYKEQCQKELGHYGMTVPTFQWDTKGITKWDNLILTVIVKHWLHAKEEGAFSKYAIDTQYSRREVILGLSESWLRGQKDNYCNPRSRRKSCKSRVKQNVSMNQFK